ncbi:MAG: multiprotein bridging factor aMBF1 [Candidatus Woesearchaeota archaeon]
MQERLEACELCGKHDKLRDVIIEGTTLSVCSKCTEFGNVIAIPEKKEVGRRVPRKIVLEEETEFINPDYSKLIKNGRERLDLKQEELAKKIAEKESVIHHLESGQLEPSFVLAKKLEKFLKIKLIERYRESGKKSLDFSDSSLTIGDLLKLKKK